jgi:hypothetical protein
LFLYYINQNTIEKQYESAKESLNTIRTYNQYGREIMCNEYLLRVDKDQEVHTIENGVVTDTKHGYRNSWWITYPIYGKAKVKILNIIRKTRKASLSLHVLDELHGSAKANKMVKLFKVKE